MNSAGNPDVAGRAHVLYTDADKDRPEVICDRNGQVVLGLCKVCGKAEAELLDHPECPSASATARRTVGVKTVAGNGWRPMTESPPKPGRYIVGHRGGIGGDAYFNAPGKPGWSQLEPCNFTHWCEPPTDGVGLLNGDTSSPPATHGGGNV